MIPTHEDRVLGGLWGVLVGDALGVPVEFADRCERDADPVEDMRAHGTHDQLAGTWSDDGAMTLCNVEALLDGFSTRRMAELFVRWYHEAHWTARGRVFDIGIATRQALGRVAAGTPPEHAGGRGERDNGNGSIMRILPVALRFADRTPETLFSICAQASCVTHGHIRSALACGLYCVYAVELLRGSDPLGAYTRTREACAALLGAAPLEERTVFSRFMDGTLAQADRSAIGSSGYVVDTLEASVWTMIQGGTFADITLRAVNLGEDTDTTGAVAGGLAGIALGRAAIPSGWRDILPRQNDLNDLFTKFLKVCPRPTQIRHDAKP